MPLQLVRNDITNMRVDAIVNAANRSLLGGGGVDGAIHRAAGPQLLEACRKLNGCETGQAKLTPGFKLPCRWVIHTVGPIWRGGHAGERELLASCYRNSLALAEKEGCESVAFPLISSGAYGYPKAEALQVAVEEIMRFLADSDMLVYIVVFTRDAVELSGRLLGDVVAYIDDVYVETHYDLSRERARMERAWPRAPLADADAFYGEASATYNQPSPARLEDMLDQVDESFSQMLLRKIDEKGISDAQCYKRANVDRRLFNKIKNNADYRPSKQTALAFAIALELSLEQTKELLLKAGYALSRSNKADIVVEYCITTGVYDLIAINQVLFKLDLQPLGY